MRVLESYINSLQIEKPLTHKNLTVQFFSRPNSMDLDILTFSEAIDSKLLEVGEVGGGSVPELRFTNKSPFSVFVAEGTIVEGLKQSRSIRASFLIGEHQDLVVPCTCVQQGRWDSIKRGRKSEYHLNAQLRAENLRHTAGSHRQKNGL